MNPPRLDPALLHHAATGQGGMQWRSLEELADTPEFRAAVQREFPAGASEFADAGSRRRFLGLMGASLALAGLSACRRLPMEKLVPYVKQPEQLIPGEPLFFASTEVLSGYARGVLVESHEGRPTKIEGNPGHPASLGATDALMQAAVLQLYDPDRSQTPLRQGQPDTVSNCFATLTAQRSAWEKNGGAGLRLVLGHTTSPALLDQIARLAARYPQARCCVHEPALNLHASHAPLPLAEKDVIFSLDADFLACGPGAVAHTKQFQKRRDPAGKMVRLYVAESTPSLTGAQADHRFVLTPQEIQQLAQQMEAALQGASPQDAPAWLPAVMRDLKANAKRALVVAGEFQPPAVHAAVRRINEALGDAAPPAATVAFPAPLQSLQELSADMLAGEVAALFILGCNPAYSAPADVPFADALAKVPLSLHHGLHADETAVRCTWHLPAAHWLEAWGDAAACDGTCSIQQPLIEPLYGGLSAHEILAVLLAQPSALGGYETVRAFWQKQHTGADFESFWRTSIHDGVIRQGARDSSRSTPPPPAAPLSSAASGSNGLTLLIRPDPHIHDGQFANNAWLQELPKPMTKLVWENAAHIAPATAKRLGLNHGDVVSLSQGGRHVDAPLWLLPGMAQDCVLIHLGYGRWRAGRVGTGLGFSAYALQTSNALWQINGLELRPTGARHSFATTQDHSAMEGRELVRHADQPAYQRDPAFAQKASPSPGADETLYPKVASKGHAWGMVINLSSCIGCSACTIACQSENNIPVVGREQVTKHREMHWLRVDRYFEGTLEAPAILHEPVPCMHCENAPCELVCPVAATVHDSEGLNAMVYNRCIGTRYCSNNCPYKVRRFNFLQFVDTETPQLKLQRNPNVSVRTRGVMEKCTYCVQRIESARISAKVAGRELRDGDVTPACAQACPAEAITFGDLNDPASKVSKLRADPRNYALLAELNTRPRTTYLAKVWNRNPEIPAA
ncbi:TAT-variant-translocated molybdopterin oxidoreductase [Prosthecobacter sp.]|uniref:TAT-variant-translocated molybdopterin oxidoreductase n=1 Tax=Prosthecobacter sp. TaxID=1965333 RepID=UPI00378393EA